MTDPLRPPETDEEPWCLRREGPATQVAREFSGTIAAACILAAFLVLALAVVTR